MRKHRTYTRDEYVSKHSLENNALQNLSAKRNWATGVIIGGMIGSLRYLNRIWKLDQGLLERAVWAIQCIETDIDEQWYKERDKTKANLAQESELNALQHGGSNAQQDSSRGSNTRMDYR